MLQLLKYGRKIILSIVLQLLLITYELYMKQNSVIHGIHWSVLNISINYRNHTFFQCYTNHINISRKKFSFSQRKTKKHIPSKESTELSKFQDEFSFCMLICRILLFVCFLSCCNIPPLREQYFALPCSSVQLSPFFYISFLSF